MFTTLTNKNDIELFELIKHDKSKKEKAFAEIYARHSKRIYQYCQRILGDRNLADDVFQETFLALLQAAERSVTMTNLPAYLLRIARNLCYNSKKEPSNNFISLDEIDIGIEDNMLEKEELSKLFVSALDILPTEYREALILQTYEGMSYQEIADFLEIPLYTARNRIVRSKKRMYEILLPYFQTNKSGNQI